MRNRSREGGGTLCREPVSSTPLSEIWVSDAWADASPDWSDDSILLDDFGRPSGWNDARIRVSSTRNVLSHTSRSRKGSTGVSPYRAPVVGRLARLTSDVRAWAALMARGYCAGVMSSLSAASIAGSARASEAATAMAHPVTTHPSTVESAQLPT